VTDTARVFRLSAVRFWLWAALLYLAFLLVVWLLLRWIGQVLDPMAVATCGLGLAIVAAVFGLRYRAVVSAEGLGFTNFDGGWVFLRWSDIEWAERGRSLGLPLLEMRVAGVEGCEGLLLLLGDMSGFREAVAAAAGPSHPITWALLESAPTSGEAEH